MDVLLALLFVYCLHLYTNWDDKRSARKFLEKHGLYRPGDE